MFLDCCYSGWSFKITLLLLHGTLMDTALFATGNQDKTCQVWDIRKLSSAIAILKGNLGATESMDFSSDGEFMVVAKPKDFVHVYSKNSDYQKCQEIDFFGEILGVSLRPDDEPMYIGI
ncbi:putative wd repeat-containing protein c2a9.03 [Quercus suber]|uniref:Wd repeat-containing protein c2a9.03 n=1 Tax=Quercus suber TaxID=58331 RepID=A0AAW0JCR4_QUESU|nr:putative wd repeat-containing protein c2a9.03 [Quercus suber]